MRAELWILLVVLLALGAMVALSSCAYQEQDVDGEIEICVMCFSPTVRDATFGLPSVENPTAKKKEQQVD